MTREQLVEEIREAFARCPPPRSGELTESGCCAECDELAEALRNLTWQDLLDYLVAQDWGPDPPYLLKPPAFRYFTPAYLIASLLAGPPSVSPLNEPELRLFWPSYAFAPGPENAESFKARYRPVYSTEERNAIVHYLSFLASRQTEDGLASRSRILDALSDVWGEFPQRATSGPDDGDRSAR
jgi:hypothetical protein